MNGDGDAVAVWYGHDGSVYRTFASYRPAGGEWSPPTALSGADGIQPAAAIDETGRAFVTWAEGGIVHLSVSNGSGQFGTPVPLSQSGSSGQLVTLDAGGTAMIVWVRNGVVEYLTRSESGSFSPPAGAQPLSDPAGGASDLHADIGAAGDIALVWRRAGGVEARYRKSGDSAFGPVQTLAAAASGVFYGRPDVAVDGNGRATAAWRRMNSNTTPTTYSIQTSDRTRTIPFGSGIDFVSYSGESIGALVDLGIDDAGKVVAAWYHAPGSGLRIEAATKPAGGSFGSTQLVSASSGGADYPEVAVNGKGDVVVVWNRYIVPISTRVIEAKYRPVGEDFDSQPVTILSSESDYADFPDVAIDGAGNAVAFWGRRNATAHSSAPFYLYSFQAAGLDAAAPTLTPSVPGSAVAESVVEMSAAVFDHWSTPSVSWDFGDGASASGTDVSHTYSAQGTYTVTVTATDGVGNTASETRTIQVAAKPAPPPPPPPPPPPAEADGDGSPAGVDADGDGSPAGVDCNDSNSSIRPGAVDIPNNGVDEDCADGDVVMRVSAAIDGSWKPNRRYTRVTGLTVKGMPANSTLQLRCSKKGRRRGSGCKFSKKTLAVLDGGSRDLTKYFNFTRRKKGEKRRVVSKLRKGTVVKITIIAPDHMGQVVKFEMRRNRAPKATFLCTAVGSTRAQEC